MRILVDGYRKSWTTDSLERIRDSLRFRDERNGSQLWLQREESAYPCLAFRFSGNIADVHYFPCDGHPGFRLLGGKGISPDGTTRLIYVGCDPGEGEDTPNEFIVADHTAYAIGEEFFLSGVVDTQKGWCEL